MENSADRKSSVTNRFRNNVVNVRSRTGLLDAFKGKSLVPKVLQQEAAAASAMFKSNNYLANVCNTNMTHGFIVNPPSINTRLRINIGESSSRYSGEIFSSLRPCVLTTTKQLPVSSSAQYAICRKHGFAAYLSLEEIEESEDYTRMVIHSPKHEVVHRYNDCVLELHDDQNLRASNLRCAEWLGVHNYQAFKDGYLVYVEEKCKKCHKNLKGEDVYMHRESRFCSSQCQSDEIVLNFEQHMMDEDPYPYIQCRRTSRDRPVKFYIGGQPLWAN
ncbi:hypothetical protein K7X08_034358 [Anisodus acutangulus]|uniref:FLZ-type domain-containing protein n=1 Tax=Anisodus acutangulus TaxID=402998 RepID=A0A9Q1LF97_9SOLA|nr:hypothetical protein K7X08_034358 [Anisodus acutangulus]